MTETHDKRTETHACDLISRQAAIDALSDYYHHTTETQHAALREALGRVESVDAVPVVHGRWTDKDGGIATCSVCGDRWGVWSVMKYCPNCGARMDGKDGGGNG